MDAINTFEHAGCTVKIFADPDPSNPRTEWDQACVFAFFHKRYSLGDDLGKVLGTDYLKAENFNGWDAMQAYIEKEFKPVYITPVFMYDHSGITISSTPFSCPWDSGRIGFAFVTRETALKEMNTKRVTKKVRDWAARYTEASIKEYDQYLRGDVYGYEVTHPNLLDEDGEPEVDSCWGFYGSDYCEEEAKSVAEAVSKQAAERVKASNENGSVCG